MSCSVVIPNIQNWSSGMDTQDYFGNRKMKNFLHTFPKPFDCESAEISPCVAAAHRGAFPCEPVFNPHSLPRGIGDPWKLHIGGYSNIWNGEGSGWEVEPVLTLWCVRGNVLKSFLMDSMILEVFPPLVILWICDSKVVCQELG